MTALFAGVSPRVIARGVMLAVLVLMVVHYWWRTRHAASATGGIVIPPAGRKIGS